MSTFSIIPYVMPAAALGQESPLPDLAAVGDPHADICIDEATVTPDEAKYMGWGRLHSILPYRMQDGYNRRKRKRAFKAIVLENEALRAVFLPSLGGRLWSLCDKTTGRELLHTNPVFQPANLGLRNAWFSGGVEWNCGIIGHTTFTCDDMACQRLTLSDGTPVLRMMQYERIRHLFYRIEALLPDGAKELYVRVRIDNALQEDTAVYWWSNMAVNEGENIRVIVPAEQAFHYGYAGILRKVPVPYITMDKAQLRGRAARLARENGGQLSWDVSRSTTLPQSMDFFFDLPQTVRPFIAALDQTGYGICQTSTPELRGRKLFAWGMGEGGRHWQTFLSQSGHAYIELQAGLARTQLEHLPMAAGASVSWLESYGPIKADSALVQGGSWAQTVQAAARALESIRPENTLAALHGRLKQELDGQNGETVHKGMGFAHCEKALLGAGFSTAGLSLSAMRKGVQEAPWLQLARRGTFPCPAPADEPVSYQISAPWEQALQQAVDAGRADHWAAHYHLGVIAHHRGDRQKARREYERSLQLAQSPWALRCLALLHKEEGDAMGAATMMQNAAAMKPIRPLVVEAMETMLAARLYTDVLTFYRSLSHALQADGRIMAYRAAALLRLNRIDEAEKVLRGRIVLTDIRENNTLPTDLWFEIAAIRRFGTADADALAWADKHVKPPKHLDFRMR